MVLSRDMAFPAMQSSALGASYPPLQIGATHRLDDDPPCGGFPSNWCHPPIGFYPPLGGDVLIIPGARHGAFPRHGRPGHAVFCPGW